jgi:hypothetical protein
VEKALLGEGEQLKEYLLGVEVFDKGQSYDPRIDPIVRVEAARLRSKLRDYYQSQGQTDSVLIEFEKGSYAPAFQRRQAAEKRAPAGSSAVVQAGWKVAVVALVVLLICTLAWAIRSARQSHDMQQQLHSSKAKLEPEVLSFWQRFLVPDAKNRVIFGSPMFFASDRLGVFVRRTTLNDPTGFVSDPAFKILQQNFGPLTGPRYDYAEMGDAVALHRLTAFFGKTGTELIALPAHESSWDQIKDGNILFLGTPRMNILLRKLPVQKDFEWRGSDDNVYNLNPQPGEQAVYSTSSNRDSVTYAVIALFPGLQEGREVMLLMSHSGPGSLAAVDFVTRTEGLRAIREKLGPASSRPKYFQMLLKVIVDNNIPVKTEYLTHHRAGSAAAGGKK